MIMTIILALKFERLDNDRHPAGLIAPDAQSAALCRLVLVDS